MRTDFSERLDLSTKWAQNLPCFILNWHSCVRGEYFSLKVISERKKLREYSRDHHGTRHAPAMGIVSYCRHTLEQDFPRASYTPYSLAFAFQSTFKFQECLCTLTSPVSCVCMWVVNCIPQLSSRVNIPNSDSILVLVCVELSRHQETLLRIKVTLAQLTSAKVLLTDPCCCSFTTYCSLCSEKSTALRHGWVFSTSLTWKLITVDITPTCIHTCTDHFFLQIYWESTPEHCRTVWVGRDI